MLRSALYALALTAAPAVMAAEVPPAMSQYIYEDLQGWVNDARIVAAIREQNMRTHGMTAEEINEQDAIWREEIGRADTPLIDTVMNAPLSDLLREYKSKSEGRITEIFVMDSKGLNVAASNVTSDYWQGDEAKFLKTYPKGPGMVFVDKIELDESTGIYQGQVSFAITDPASGEVVGAITVGLDAGAFF